MLSRPPAPLIFPTQRAQDPCRGVPQRDPQWQWFGLWHSLLGKMQTERGEGPRAKKPEIKGFETTSPRPGDGDPIMPTSLNTPPWGVLTWALGTPAAETQMLVTWYSESTASGEAPGGRRCGEGGCPSQPGVPSSMQTGPRAAQRSPPGNAKCRSVGEYVTETHVTCLLVYPSIHQALGLNLEGPTPCMFARHPSPFASGPLSPGHVCRTPRRGTEA